MAKISQQKRYHFRKRAKIFKRKGQKFPMKKGTIVAIKCSKSYTQQLIVMQHCLDLKTRLITTQEMPNASQFPIRKELFYSL